MRRNLARSRCTWALACAAGCGGREPIWEAPASAGASVQPVRALSPSPMMRPTASSCSAPAGPVASTVVPCRWATRSSAPRRGRRGPSSSCFARETAPRQQPDDEKPSLTVIDVDDPGHPRASSFRALDARSPSIPRASWVVAYAGDGAQGSFITNPNELLFIDLDPAATADAPAAAPSRVEPAVYPKRITFSPHAPARRDLAASL